VSFVSQGFGRKIILPAGSDDVESDRSPANDTRRADLDFLEDMTLGNLLEKAA
jgi:hypothetical protein